MIADGSNDAVRFEGGEREREPLSTLHPDDRAQRPSSPLPGSPPPTQPPPSLTFLRPHTHPISLLLLMILSVLIFNTHGVPRLSKFYTATPPPQQRQLIAQIYKLVADRPQGLCSFLDAPELRQGFFGTTNNNGGGSGQAKGKARETTGGGGGGFGRVDEDEDVRVIYRSVVQNSHSALGIRLQQRSAVFV